MSAGPPVRSGHTLWTRVGVLPTGLNEHREIRIDVKPNELRPAAVLIALFRQRPDGSWGENLTRIRLSPESARALIGLLERALEVLPQLATPPGRETGRLDSLPSGGESPCSPHRARGN